MTQGYVYDSAEAQEARFNGEEPGYVYSRYSNPTISMFENRMALLEGAGRRSWYSLRHGGCFLGHALLRQGR